VNKAASILSTLCVFGAITVACGKFGAGDSSSSSSGGTSSSSSSGQPVTPDGAPSVLDAGEETDARPGVTRTDLCNDMPPACATAPVKITRFDNPVTSEWQPLGTTLELQDEAFCTPKALRAAAQFPSEENAFLAFSFGAFSKVRLRYAVRGPVHIANTKLQFGCFFVMRAGGSDQTTDIRFDLEQDGKVQLDGETSGSAFAHDPGSVSIPSASTDDTWKIVELAIDRGADDTSLIVTGRYDGTPFTNTYKVAVAPNTNQLRCGLAEIEGSGSALHVVFLDDIQFQACPP